MTTCGVGLPYKGLDVALVQIELRLWHADCCYARAKENASVVECAVLCGGEAGGTVSELAPGGEQRGGEAVSEWRASDRPARLSGRCVRRVRSSDDSSRSEAAKLILHKKRAVSHLQKVSPFIPRRPVRGEGSWQGSSASFNALSARQASQAEEER